MPSAAIEITTACFQAYVDKDRAAIERLIAPDFHFTSPLDNRIDRNTYFDRCWPNSENISAFDIKAIALYGDRVFVTYEGHAGGRVFRNTEVFTIRDGQIAEVEVYFGWSLPHEAPLGGFIDPRGEHTDA